MKVQVIVPTHNRKDYLRNLLACLKVQTVSVDVLVVVAGSTDGTVGMLKNEYPETELILGEDDWWYTRSMNEGFKYALERNNPDLFLTMNDDTEVKRDYIANLLDAYKKIQEESLIGSLSYTKSIPHKVLTSGSFFSNKSLYISKNYLKLFEEVKFSKIGGRIFTSNLLAGRGMLIPVEILLDLNFFDEIFKQYHSDSDFCLRAQKKNYNVYISWDAQVLVNKNMTGLGTSYIRKSFIDFIKSFFQPTSRLYLPSKSRIIWRHGSKILWPLSMVIFLLASFKNYLFESTSEK